MREIHIGILALTKIHSNKRDSAFSKPVNNYDLNILFQYNAQWVVLTKIFTKNSIFSYPFQALHNNFLEVINFLNNFHWTHYLLWYYYYFFTNII